MPDPVDVFYVREPGQVAINRKGRLLNTNIGFRKTEKLCTEAESCPMQVSHHWFQPE